MLPAQAAIEVGEDEGWASLQPLGDEAGEKPVRVRFTRAADTLAYLREPIAEPADVEWLTAAETAREDLMLGLRLTRGVAVAQVEQAGLS